MTCHYSCATCSSGTYADLCLSCAVNRYLMDTTCLCSSNYYEYQQSSCVSYDSIQKLDYTLNIMLQSFYYIMIGFSWLFILANINHIYSAKIRSLVTFLQLTSLLLQYRFRFSSISQKALEVFSVWNFRYFNTLLCTRKSFPYLCSTYENIYGPLMTLASFMVLLILSFILTKTCILSLFTQRQEQRDQAQIVIINRGKQPQYKKYQGTKGSSVDSMSFSEYVRITFKSFFLMYLDFSIVQWSLQLSRIAYISSYLFLLYIPLVILIISYSLYTLKTINSLSQFKIEYRSQLGYFYLFDQNYHLNYLDYLYQQQKSARNPRNYEPTRYYPHSNYLIVEIIVKFCIASTTIIMFQYKPQLWTFPFMFVLLITFFKLQVFQVYQRLALLIYLLGLIMYLITMATFFIDSMFNAWMVVVVILTSTGFFVLAVSDLSDWSRQKQGKYWSVAFQYLNGQAYSEKDQQKQSLQSQQEQSNDQLFKNKQISIQDLTVQENNNLQVAPNNTVGKSMFAKSKLAFRKNNGNSSNRSMNNQMLNHLPVLNQPLQNSQVSQVNEGSNKLKNPSMNESFMSRTNRSKFGHTKRDSNEQQNKSKQTYQKTKDNIFTNKRDLPDIEQDNKEQNEEVDSNISLNHNGQERKSQDLLIRDNQDDQIKKDYQIEDQLQRIHGAKLKPKVAKNNSVSVRSRITQRNNKNQ